MRQTVLLTWIVVAGCATEPGVAPSPAPVAAQAEPSVDVARGDVQGRPVTILAVPSHHAVETAELRVMVLESFVRCFESDRELAVMDKYSCAFYWDLGKRPVPDDPAERWRVTKDYLDRVSADIDETRAGLADPAECAAFDAAVTDRFRAVRARIDAMTGR